MTTRWAPFVLAPPKAHGDAPRSLETPEGVGDRLRAAAFAEVQARDAFLWAAERFGDASEDLKRAWRALATAEQRHLDWLLARMTELGIDITARKVSDHLWVSLTTCESAREFAHFMAGAEERGRRAGERFHQALLTRDPLTAGIFGKIAHEEIAHIELAARFFPQASLAAGATEAAVSASR